MIRERAKEVLPGKRRHAHPSQLAGSAGRRWLMLAAEMVGLANGRWYRGGACGARVAVCALSADAGSVRAARRFTVATMSRWGTVQRSQDIAIVVSELLANALRHAPPADPVDRRPIQLGLLLRRPWVLCAVADPSTAVPAPQIPNSFAESGRGLQLICALSDRWGYTPPNDSGKVVWAMFYSPPAVCA